MKILLMFIFICQISFCQEEYEINGIIYDEQGDLVVGVTVEEVQGNKTITNFDGIFTLKTKSKKFFLNIYFNDYLPLNIKYSFEDEELTKLKIKNIILKK